MPAFWYQLWSEAPLAPALFLLAVVFSRRVVRDRELAELGEAARRLRARDERRSREEEAAAAVRAGLVSADDARAALPHMARAFSRGAVSMEELTACWEGAARAARGAPPAVMADDLEVTPLPQAADVLAAFAGAGGTVDDRHLDTCQGKGVESGSMDESRMALPLPLHARMAALSARVSSAVETARASELRKEEKDAEYMAGDPRSCMHLSAVDVEALDGTVVGRLCPACGTALGLEGES